MDEHIVTLRSITPVWTAGLDRDGDVPREVGLMGSIRWWYEVLVRGLGGFACDPTDNDRCAFDDAGYKVSGVDDGLRTVCPTCRLFGCGGWASKVRLLATDAKGNSTFSLEKAGTEFQLHFWINKPLLVVETWLLHQTFHLIDQYGALGGRTTLKPPKQPDYGQVRVLKNIPLSKKIERSDVTAWLVKMTQNSSSMQSRQAHQSSEIPQLGLFFFKNNQWLDRRQMNDIVKTDRSGFMAGKRGISKKIFSSNGGNRFWGYAKDQRMLDSMLRTLDGLRISGVKTGQEVLHGL
ncbi:type III-B CRISPR module RAMP protein Cmr1 [Anaerolineales bacterium HSG24]|nr:type III-B CRISPR module RAMP protein Cmr1 [Anaerolineales bacterium HSG24]